MKTRTVAGATLFAAMSIAQSGFTAVTALPKLPERQPAQEAFAPPVQIGCQYKDQKCANQPSVAIVKDEDGTELEVAVCYAKQKVVHAVKLKFCPPPAPAML